MKIFTNKNLIQKIILVFLCVFLLNFCMTPSVQASVTGSLFTPMKEFITAIEDIFITLVQWGITGDWISAVDENGIVQAEYSDKWDFVSRGLLDYPVIQISPELIFGNQIKLLDVNFVGNQNKDYNIDSGNKIVIGDGNVVTTLRTIIASWYVTLRTISMVGLLSVLLYIGIRIMIASTAGDKAKYKQMIMDWIVAFCILLFMHFIMSGMINVVDRINDLLADNIVKGVNLDTASYGTVTYNAGYRGSSDNIPRGIVENFFKEKGIEGITVSNVESNEWVGQGQGGTTWYNIYRNGKIIGQLKKNYSSEGNSWGVTANQYDATIQDGLLKDDQNLLKELNDRLKGGYTAPSGDTTKSDAINVSSSEGYSVYIAENATTDGSKILYFINYARLYVNLDDPYTSFGFIILYGILIVFTTMFAVRYMKRVIYIAFLTLIAPLVALTYPIDKIKDGQAQAFNMWFREYVFNVMIQPFHLLIYTILMGSAVTLASEHMIYAIVAIGFLIPAEKLLRKFFGFDKAQTLSAAGSFAGGAIFSSVLSKINRTKSGGKGGSSGDNENGRSAGTRKPESGIEMNSRNILMSRMAEGQRESDAGDADTDEDEDKKKLGQPGKGNPPEEKNEEPSESEQKANSKKLTDSVFENSSKWKLARSKGILNRLDNVMYSKIYSGKTKFWNKAKTLPKAGGRLIRKAAIGGFVGGSLGALGLAVGAASGDPSKAFSLAASGGAAGYYGANYYGDKLAKVAGKEWQSAKVNFWGQDIKKIEQDKFDKQFLSDPKVRDTLIRALNSPQAVEEAINSGKVQAFLNRGITDAGKIGKSLLLLENGKVRNLEEAVAVAEWNRDLGPAIFDESSEHRAAYIRRTIKELKRTSPNPDTFDEKIAEKKIKEVLDNINYLNI